MRPTRHRFSPADSLVDATLESRVVLSASPLHQTTVEVAARSAHGATTSTTMTIQSGTLGQPTTFNLMVRAAGAQGSPQGTVNLLDHGQLIQTVPLSPTTTHSSAAITTLTPPPGGDAPFFGKHTITAEFIPASGFSKSSATRSYTIAPPTYTTIANGVKVAIVAHGTGPAIQSGQYAEVLYTGYLAKNGTIFDASNRVSDVPLGFNLGAGQMIPGFDAGTTGMRVGETRIIEIPPSQGYGATANGTIPPNSTLIFLVTLKAIV